MSPPKRFDNGRQSVFNNESHMQYTLTLWQRGSGSAMHLLLGESGLLDSSTQGAPFKQEEEKSHLTREFRAAHNKFGVPWIYNIKLTLLSSVDHINASSLGSITAF